MDYNVKVVVVRQVVNHMSYGSLVSGHCVGSGDVFSSEMMSFLICF